jgi:hypothetical protein
MVARVTPAGYGLIWVDPDHLPGTAGGLPKKQLAAAHFDSKIRPNIKVLAGNAISAKERAADSPRRRDYE